MIDIQDLIEIKLNAILENIEILSADNFSSSCNISTKQLESLKSNCEQIISAIQHYQSVTRTD